VLQDNGGDSLPVSASGAFHFLTKLAAGATYAVSVSTQPSAATQICTVTSGSGTVGSADVTNVAVNCVTQSYTITATVTGLTGTGLTLQVNALTAVSATANAHPYALGTLASGTAYTIHVVNPTGPTQNCVPVPASGTVGAAAIPVAVTCTISTFTLGGTITGYSGTGLVVKDTVSGNTTSGALTTSFSLAAVNSGATYSIVILTEPTAGGQWCTVVNNTGTVGGANVTNANITCRNESKYLFVADTTGGAIYSYTIDRSNTATAGVLTALNSASPTPVGSAPNAIAVNPAGTFLYASDGGTASVDVFSVTAGVVAYVTATPTGVTGSAPTNVAVDPTGKYLLVTDNNTAGNGLIEVFAIDPSLGTLMQIADSPFDTAGGVPGAAATSVAVDPLYPTAPYAYGTNQFSATGLVGFSIDTGATATAGDLTALTNSGAGQTTDSAVSVTIDPHGRFVYLANNIDGMVSGWTIGAGGSLTALTGNPYALGTGAGATTAAAVIDPTGEFLYATDSAHDKVAGFSLNQTAGPNLGVPTALTGGAVTAGTVPGPIVVDASGRFVYVGNINSVDISMFAAGSATGLPTGVLAALSASPLDFTLVGGIAPNALATF
jgi:6-phosphogluconolactonase (cycloisomerase 2 family)